MVDIRLVGSGSGAFGSGTGSYDSLGGSGVPASGSLTTDTTRYQSDLVDGLANNYVVLKRDLGQVRAVSETYQSVKRYPAIQSNDYVSAVATIVRAGEAKTGTVLTDQRVSELLYQGGLPVPNPSYLSPSGQVVSAITPTRSHAVPVPASPSPASLQASSVVDSRSLTGPVSPPAPSVPQVVAGPLVTAPAPPSGSSATPGDTAPILTIHVPSANENRKTLAEQILESMREIDKLPTVSSSEIERPIAGMRPVVMDTVMPVTGVLVPQAVQATLAIPPPAPTPAPTPADLTAIESLKQVPPSPPSIASKLGDQAVAAVIAGAGAAGSSLLHNLVNTPIANLGQSVLDVVAPGASPRVVSSTTAVSNFYLYLTLGLVTVYFITRKR